MSMRIRMLALRKLEAVARERIARVAHDPEARYQLRHAFYRKYGSGTLASAGYGASELAFMRWEIERGLLNPLDHPERPGSPYWRVVNGQLCYYAELAALVHEAGVPHAAVGPEVRAWLAYFAEPSPRTWYRAHTSSLIRGMIDHHAEARKEPLEERLFINETLYRLLYAEAIVLGAVLGDLGRLVADPRLPAVHLIVQLQSLYPRHYPLRPGEMAGIVTHWPHITGLVHRSAERILARILDRTSIMPELVRRYLCPLVDGHVEPAQLQRMMQRGEPIYPDLCPDLRPDTGPDFGPGLAAQIQSAA